MPMIYTTNVSVKIGLSSTTGQYTNVTSGLKSFMYDEVQGESGEGASPAFTINSTTPNGLYNPPHKYVKLTLQTISDLYTPLYTTNGTSPTYGPYIVPSGDNVSIPYFVVSAGSSSGTVTFTCTNVYPGKVTMTLDTTGKEVVTQYSFVCDSVTPSA